jgi:hypothetical protein
MSSDFLQAIRFDRDQLAREAARSFSILCPRRSGTSRNMDPTTQTDDGEAAVSFTIFAFPRGLP